MPQRMETSKDLRFSKSKPSMFFSSNWRNIPTLIVHIQISLTCALAPSPTGLMLEDVKNGLCSPVARCLSQVIATPPQATLPHSAQGFLFPSLTYISHVIWSMDVLPSRFFHYLWIYLDPFSICTLFWGPVLSWAQHTQRRLQQEMGFPFSQKRPWKGCHKPEKLKTGDSGWTTRTAATSSEGIVFSIELEPQTLLIPLCISDIV